LSQPFAKMSLARWLKGAHNQQGAPQSERSGLQFGHKSLGQTLAARATADEQFHGFRAMCTIGARFKIELHGPLHAISIECRQQNAPFVS
jgi:hypothetical protein